MTTKSQAHRMIGAIVIAFLLATLPVEVSLAAPPNDGRGDHGNGNHIFRHVLLISIDGMHSVDFINCSQGIAGVNGGAPYCPNLASLAANGVNYLDASTSKPSDSFPGLTAIISGGMFRTSATTWAATVSCPCPCDTEPMKTTTSP